MLGNSHFNIVRRRAEKYLREEKSTPESVIQFIDRYEPRSFA